MSPTQCLRKDAEPGSSFSYWAMPDVLRGDSLCEVTDVEEFVVNRHNFSI